MSPAPRKPKRPAPKALAHPTMVETVQAVGLPLHDERTPVWSAVLFDLATKRVEGK